MCFARIVIVSRDRAELADRKFTTFVTRLKGALEAVGVASSYTSLACTPFVPHSGAAKSFSAGEYIREGDRRAACTTSTAGTAPSGGRKEGREAGERKAGVKGGKSRGPPRSRFPANADSSPKVSQPASQSALVPSPRCARCFAWLCGCGCVARSRARARVYMYVYVRRRLPRSYTPPWPHEPPLSRAWPCIR